MFKTIKLKDAPELRRLVLAAAPWYRKQSCTLHVSPEILVKQESSDGCAVYAYMAVNLDTLKTAEARPCGLPGMGVHVEIPRRVCIVRTGTFCSKESQASITLHPDDVSPLLPA